MTTINNEHLSKALKLVREEKDMTVEQVSNYFGDSIDDLAKIENNKINVHLEQLNAFADLYEVELHYIFFIASLVADPDNAPYQVLWGYEIANILEEE